MLEQLNTNHMKPLLSDAEYRKAEGISNSKISDFAKAPYYYYCKNVIKTIPDKDTEAMCFGRLLHHAILEPKSFGENVVVQPSIDGRTKDGKEAKKIFAEENAGKEIISASDDAQIKGMRAQVFNHPSAKDLLNDSEYKEVSFFWTDKETGLQLKARVDAFSEKHKLIIDVKSTLNAGKHGGNSFITTAFNYRYHVQAAFYMEALKNCIDESDRDFAFIAVEKDAPYMVATYFATQEQIEIGRYIMRQDLRALADCYASNKWAAYSEKLEEMGLPSWALKQYSEMGVI